MRPVSMPDNVPNHPIEIVSEGEELPVGAWFQLFEDSAVSPRSGTTRYRFYVREYGLLISSTRRRPAGRPGTHRVLEAEAAPGEGDEARRHPK